METKEAKRSTEDKRKKLERVKTRIPREARQKRAVVSTTKT